MGKTYKDQKRFEKKRGKNKSDDDEEEISKSKKKSKNFLIEEDYEDFEEDFSIFVSNEKEE